MLIYFKHASPPTRCYTCHLVAAIVTFWLLSHDQAEYVRGEIGNNT